jgi:hypothetical protein
MVGWRENEKKHQQTKKRKQFGTSGEPIANVLIKADRFQALLSGCRSAMNPSI